ncbi:putative G-protein coupled receptor Mth-like 6 isoform X2 [Lycorma delicatula]|uniref:putative G-protein coupled receptor Mth-like 6 isoform X2 n=1 Tax=Lycorma delicatula TaxID=130591 RepID=UPI003F5173D8
MVLLRSFKVRFGLIIYISVCFNFSICFSQNDKIPKLQKCCKSDEQLSYFTCERITDNATKSKMIFNDDGKPWWLPSNAFLSSKDGNLISFYPTNDSNRLGIKYGAKHCDYINEAEFWVFDNDHFIYDNGSLLITSEDKNVTYPSDSYCVDLWFNHTKHGDFFVILVCPCNRMKCVRKCCNNGMIFKHNENEAWECRSTENNSLEWKPEHWRFEKDLRKNVNDYNLIAHVSCLFLAYIGHIIIIFAIQLIKYNIVCKIMGFVLQFSLFASFLWLNIICVNISLAFSQLKPLTNTIQGQSEKNKFLYYSFYVWIITSLLTVITIVAEYSSILPEEFRPGFGENRCWFKGLKPSLLFFHGPMTATLLGNVALFLNTSFHIYMTQRDVAGVTKNVIHVHKGKRNPKNRYRFTIYMKLCFLMGITWIFEVLSVLYYDSLIILWNITDILNLLRALFIFALFCCKDKVIRIIKARIFKSKNDRHNSSQRSVGNFSKKASLSSIRTSSFQLSRLSISQVVDKNCVY